MKLSACWPPKPRSTQHHKGGGCSAFSQHHRQHQQHQHHRHHQPSDLTTKAGVDTKHGLANSTYSSALNSTATSRGDASNPGSLGADYSMTSGAQQQIPRGYRCKLHMTDSRDLRLCGAVGDQGVPLVDPPHHRVEPRVDGSLHVPERERPFKRSIHAAAPLQEP